MTENRGGLDFCGESSPVARGLMPRGPGSGVLPRLVTVVTAALSLFSFTGCRGETGSYAEWQIPVGSGEQVRESRPLPVDKRVAAIGLVEEIAIGRGQTAPPYVFGLILDLAIDNDGQIYLFARWNRAVARGRSPIARRPGRRRW